MSPVCQSIYFLDPYSHTLSSSLRLRLFLSHSFSLSRSFSITLSLALSLYHFFSRSLSITLSLSLFHSLFLSRSLSFSPSHFTLSSLLIFFFVPSFTLYRSIVQPICFRIELLSSSELNLNNCLITRDSRPHRAPTFTVTHPA